MNILFYLSGLVAVLSTLLVVTGRNAVHALLYLIVSLLAVSLVLFSVGAPFVAALEVIIYAGAIMVLFLVVIMMLNLGRETSEQEARWLTPGIWRGPAVLCAVLLAEAVVFIVQGGATTGGQAVVSPKAVGIALFGPYVLAVELASLLLLAGLVGAYHLGRRKDDRT